MLKLAIGGAMGKMGRRISALSLKDDSFKIICLLEKENHADLGKDYSGIKLSCSVSDIKQADCLIDFSAVGATLKNLEKAVEYKKPMVIGTTGFDCSGKDKIKNAAEKIPVVFSPNMSFGVNLLFKLVKDASSKLSGYKVNIIEAHHVHKKDAPSGTAKKIKEIIEEKSLKIENIDSIREGEIIGDHKIIFDGEFDKIELSHSAKTRDIFAEGALLAAKWVVGKNAGLYSMLDILEGK
ncbi:MAG: 4-hydroxy-tetrahydrodipicolinate reductase [Candidatus Gygaella obscura]|nr:4-hydroxy-tetrahydrodipicolinate reductase [Candidatus Gygaella obscura]